MSIKIKYISTKDLLNEFRSALINQCKEYEIDALDCSIKDKDSQSINQSIEELDEKMLINVELSHSEGMQTETKPIMFDYVNKMQLMMRIKGTNLEKKLFEFEKKLISKAAKKSIPSHCQYCNAPTPEDYPDDIYLCKKHRSALNKKLGEYEIKIPNENCTEEAKKNCVIVKQAYNRIQESLNEEKQSCDQNQFPKNYFSITMAKLLHCRRELQALSPETIKEKKIGKQTRDMKKIVKQLMDLLIVVRQSMNPTSAEIVALITAIASIIGGGVAWMVTNSAFIVVLVGLLIFFVGILILGVIFGQDKMKCVAGVAAIGGTFGFALAGIGTATLVVEESSKYGAMIGTFCGGPGAGTVAGACVGGLLGGVFAGGCAVVKYFG